MNMVRLYKRPQGDHLIYIQMVKKCKQLKAFVSGPQASLPSSTT